MMNKAQNDTYVVVEPRASTILFNLAQIAPPGVFLLPANICPEVPLALASAGRRCVFVDIEPDSWHMSHRRTLDAMESRQVAGIVYVRAYGALQDDGAFFAALKEQDGNALVIDDRCLCRPAIDNHIEADSNVDAVLFSTGHGKYLDLGGGGYAVLGHGLSYERFSSAYSQDHRRAVEERLSPGYAIDVENAPTANGILASWPNWLDTGSPIVHGLSIAT